MIAISIKQKRLEAGMSQMDLAKAVGVFQSTVSGWEKRSVVPQPKNLKKIADALNCKVADLLED